MGDHINRDGKFQSDKYPTCPAGKVPLSTSDKTAQDLLWAYAQRRRAVDAEFAADLETCLRADGYAPGTDAERIAEVVREACASAPGWQRFKLAATDVDAIATRVAEQLAAPTERRPSLAERRAHHGMAPASSEERRDNLERNLDSLAAPVPTLSTDEARQLRRRLKDWEVHYGASARLVERLLDGAQVAAPVLSAEERDVMLRMRKSIQWDGQFSALLDRLLGGGK